MGFRAGLQMRWVVVAMVLSANCSGCITASLATIGTVLGALGSAASTGADVYKLGKLEATLQSSADDCHRAVMSAAADLGLHVIINQLADPKNDVWEMTLHDDLKSPVGIHIERRTDKMCRCRVDVGIFGSQPTANLFIERVRAHLHKFPTSAELCTRGRAAGLRAPRGTDKLSQVFKVYSIRREAQSPATLPRGC